MKLYSKLGLLALLTSSALFSMEMPPQKATSNENDIIHICAHDTTLAKNTTLIYQKQSYAKISYR